MIDFLPGIKESAVIGLRDPDFGEMVAAIVVADSPWDAPGAEEIAMHVRSRLAAFKVPNQVHFVQELPRNAMGKVQKAVLRQRYGVQAAPI